MADERSAGKRFTDIYVERGPPTDDSAAMRGRLAYFLVNKVDAVYTIAAALREETGVSVWPNTLVKFFNECTLHQLLNSITCIAHRLPPYSDHRNPTGGAWLYFVGSVFKQENLAYTVDDKGGVHPAHDDEFEASRRATIAGMDASRYAAARDFFQRAMEDLKPPRDTRDAVRKTFEAVENVAKLMCPNDIERLGATEVKCHLQPIALGSTTNAERNARSRMIESLAEWVNGCQQYRHAAGQPEPDAPSLDLALHLVSSGAAHLRWLITLDRDLSEQASR